MKKVKTVQVRTVEVKEVEVKQGKVCKNIYAELRGDFVKFVVQVSPLPRISKTFDLAAFGEGFNWANGERIKLADKKNPKSSAVPRPAPTVASAIIPEKILVRDVLDGYRKNKLDKLAGSKSESSRLKNLEEWFGSLDLGAFRPSIIEKWMDDRSSGKLGSGRVRKTDLTKHQRHYRKQAGLGAAVPEVIGPISQQTVRHELVLLRRAIATYFDEHQLTLAHGQWLLSQHIMKMKLPDRPDSRETRLADEPLEAVLRELAVPDHQCYVLLAIATTLRRGELCTLHWEDVDFENNLMKLKSPGHYKKTEETKNPNQKTKVRARSVPLMPAAVAVLRKLGPEASGRIFTMTPGGYSQAWRRAADRAGYPDVRLHDMRREGISRLVELVDAPLETVVAFSGHSDVGVLQRHYVKPRADIIVSKLANRQGAERLLPSATAT